MSCMKQSDRKAHSPDSLKAHHGGFYKVDHRRAEMLSSGEGSESRSCPRSAGACPPHTVPAPFRPHPGSELFLLLAPVPLCSRDARKGLLPSQWPHVLGGTGCLALGSRVQSLSFTPSNPLARGRWLFSKVLIHSPSPVCVYCMGGPASPILPPGPFPAQGDWGRDLFLLKKGVHPQLLRTCGLFSAGP